MTDELYHSGHKGMRWYQHIFGDEAKQRRRAKRMKKNADKVARIKEKMKLIEEKNKLSDIKKKRRAQINRMFEPDEDEALNKAKKAKEIAQLKNDRMDEKRRGIQKVNRIFEDPDANDKQQTVDGSRRVVKKANALAAPQTSARAIARSMGGMSDEEVQNHLKRLSAEKQIRALASEEAERAKNPIQKYIKNTLNNALGNATNALVSYGTKKASDVIIGAIESRLAGAKPETDKKANDKIKKANERARGADRMKDYVSPFGKDVAVDEGYSLDNRNSSSSVDRIINLASAISGNKNTGAAVKAVVDAVKAVPVNEAKQMFALPPPTAKSERERPSVLYL